MAWAFISVSFSEREKNMAASRSEPATARRELVKGERIACDDYGAENEVMLRARLEDVPGREPR